MYYIIYIHYKYIYIFIIHIQYILIYIVWCKDNLKHLRLRSYTILHIQYLIFADKVSLDQSQFLRAFLQDEQEKKAKRRSVDFSTRRGSTLSSV